MINRERLDREIRLIGLDATEKLAAARVAVFGVGGVGSFACEALARAGIGAIDLIDSDVVDVTNINRQLIALTSTCGRSKVEVMKERILDINPDCCVTAHQIFMSQETADDFDFGAYDYVLDAVDTVAAKELLILRCAEVGTPIISSMGTGNKLDPAAFKVADISKTSVCPLARVMRKRLRKAGIDQVKVVYSEEEPIKAAGQVNAGQSHEAMPPASDAAGQSHGTTPPASDAAGQSHGTTPPASDASDSGRAAPPPASISFVPPVAGLIMAGEAVKDIIGSGEAVKDTIR